MRKPPTPRLAAVFVAVVLSFVAATGIVHWQMRAVDDAVLAITDNAAPSIEHLVEARSELRHLQVRVNDYLESASGGARGAAWILQVREAIERAVDAYLALPPAPRELERREDVLRARNALVSALADLEHAGFAREAVARIARERLRPSIAELNDAITSAMRANAVHAAESGRRIHVLRVQTTWLGYALDVACTAIAVAGAFAVRRSIRDHAELLERHRALHEERATELDAFSARVAHDIRSPLGTVGLALSLAAVESDAEKRKRSLERAAAAVERIKRLVEGLLDFARAGGKPSRDARAEVGEAVTDVVLELQPIASDAGAEVSFECEGHHVVACSPGVLTSLLANLARNAVKYLGNGPLRRVVIRARSVGRAVRIEVADTGPGLAPEIAPHVFEPYVRAPNAAAPGIGLGLATVKRLAEAHGGNVGVTSSPGAGSTFWFELPEAPRTAP